MKRLQKLKAWLAGRTMRCQCGNETAFVARVCEDERDLELIVHECEVCGRHYEWIVE